MKTEEHAVPKQVEEDCCVIISSVVHYSKDFIARQTPKHYRNEIFMVCVLKYTNVCKYFDTR